MAASSLVDLVKIYATNQGTGALTLGEAVQGYRGVEALLNGATYSYSIQQDAQWEIGKATYLAADNQLVRTPLDSSNGGSTVDFQANAAIAFVALSEDILARDVLQPLYGFGPPLSGQGLIGQTYTDLTQPVTLYGPKTASGWGSGVVLQGADGKPGTAASYETIEALREADPKALFYVLLNRPGGTNYTLTPGNYTDRVDDDYVIKLNAVPLSTGALVRQGAESIALPGAPGINSNLGDVFADARRTKAYFGAKGDARRVMKPDGTPDDANFIGTDDTQALKDAFAEAMRNGFELTLERGSYIISDTLLATIGTDQQQPSIRGAGPALTEFIQIDKSKDAIRILGNMPRRDLFAMSGFRVTYPDSWGIGLPTGRAITVENVRSLVMEGIRTFRSGLGYNLVGCLDVQLRELVTYYDFIGMKLERGTYESFPNAISFDRVEIQASYRTGIDIVGGCAITIDGASTIENIGTENIDPNGPLPGGGGVSGRSIALVLSESGFAGSVAIAGRGLYFEANRDYNIYINHANRPALYKFDACNFNRFNGIRILNDIVFDCPLGDVSTASAVLDVRGCSFTGFNGYTPSPDLRKIGFTIPNGYSGLEFLDDGVLYGEDIERPAVPQNVVHPRPAAFSIFSVDGSVEGSGVKKIDKMAPGIYRIFPMRGARGIVPSFQVLGAEGGVQLRPRISDLNDQYIEVTWETIGATPVATAASFFASGIYR